MTPPPPTLPLDTALRQRLPLVVALLCSIPFWFSLPSLGDPFGQSEESVNATIWGLGARNLLAEGPVAAKLGARVAPYPGPGGREGIYAHHPPLPVWLSAAVQLTLGEREAGPRLAALLLAGLSLLLLFGLLRTFTGEAIAAVATAAIATCPYVLDFGRLLSTLTLATPLFLFALRAALRRGLEGQPWRWTLPAALAALVFSSWDGVLGAIAVAGWVTVLELRAVGAGRSAAGWLRALGPALGVALCLAAVFGYLLWANGGVEPLVWQFRYRAGSNLPSPGVWCAKQLTFLSEGLGWLPLLALAAAPALWLHRDRPRGLMRATALSAVPGLGMLLIFRQGADRHPFWAYNLILPAAFALAGVLHAAATSRRPVLALGLTAALVAQAAAGFRLAGEHLGRERLLNGHGALARDWFGAHPAPVIRILSAYNFYPFVSWYLRVPTDVIPTAQALRERLLSGSFGAGEAIVVDMDLARRLGCAPFPVAAESSSHRWVIAAAGAVGTACGG